MKYRLSAVACLALSVVLALPVAAQSDPKKNAELEKTVSALLVQKLGADAGTIKVSVVGDKATLIGQVTERSTREIADEVALFVDGIKKVDNQVKATKEKSLVDGKIKKELADNKLESAVESKVKAELGAHYKTITIECTAAVCSIRGTLPDQSRKDLALKTATAVEGVKKIVELIKIKG